ncbi:MAG: methylenetetrahydrofolate--tRNA-(uracil(54)-C(5))-methyltransferase (FADH(2)-oxidizing) TrmFO [Acholeplasmatales bacterium]|jgi:methylenetetrahydrofolate--tRNA-(uracil-5-)-methyltransferase|nr:methylenetetrahydrofolate--tRNA-(uracil(54)-C(5))-methyltransferase (FADH(2)-oxidizing) TrmFO [Acholeplasmatales bacterium]
MPKKFSVQIIGGGLAGCEAAWFLANKGIGVKLYEMRPKVSTAIHQSGFLGELVCSNSFKNLSLNHASGILKAEMKKFDSLVMQVANQSTIEGGTSLIVDRETFMMKMNEMIINHPLIEVIREEVVSLDLQEYTIVCSGPLTSDALFHYLAKNIIKSAEEDLYFYDAVAPIVKLSSIDLNLAYYKARYDKGVASYLNCPLSKDEYKIFYEALISAKLANNHPFDRVYEGCLPVEVLAKRGYEALLYGPLKPVGLEINHQRPEAVIQLRQDDFHKSLYNIVGFQTSLAFKEQERVLKLVPALRNVEIIRYGVYHRNTYINSPKILSNYQSKEFPKLFFAGQITGVEGYLESASSGILAASYLYSYLKTKAIIPLSRNTIMGGLANYLNCPNQTFVPMHANFMLVEEEVSIKKRDLRNQFYYERSIQQIDEYLERIGRLS